MKTLSFAQAINEALHQLLAEDERVFVLGQGVKSPWYVGSTAEGLEDRFGKRIIDPPISENGFTGAAVGAALAGMHPIVEHPRVDFMYLAMDQIFNHAASWHYMFGGKANVPLTIWGIVNRGGEQAAQHSQALHAMFAHVPGLKVIAPSTPYDVKGMLISAVRSSSPVMFMDDRWLYDLQGDVPEDMFEVPIGQGIIRREGSDLTIVAVSWAARIAAQAADTLAAEGISVELVDPRTVKPLDRELILQSVRNTGRLLVVDGGWRSYGFAAEILATVFEQGMETLKAPAKRITLPDAPAPASSALEKAYYPSVDDIVATAKLMMKNH